MLAGCGDQGESLRTKTTPPPTETPPVIVSVAASTHDAVREIAATWRQATGVEVQLNTGASSTLASQILAGAPADLFLSASREWAEAVAQQDQVQDTVELLGNRLVIVTPRGAESRIASPQDLLSDDVETIALAGEKVPAGVYADQALWSLGLHAGVQGKIVRGADVRIVLSYVERGEADAGLVYATDAALSSQIHLAAVLPEDSHEPIVYPLVLLKHGSNPAAAREFFAFLQSREAQAVFDRFGFLISTTPRE
jgi:molybdate transport system substrate-binding protein